jgi:hypothetical protein
LDSAELIRNTGEITTRRVSEGIAATSSLANAFPRQPVPSLTRRVGMDADLALSNERTPKKLLEVPQQKDFDEWGHHILSVALISVSSDKRFRRASREHRSPD